jgi:hypothetical protein
MHFKITQEEIGALSGVSRQNANQMPEQLEREGLLRLEYGGVTSPSWRLTKSGKSIPRVYPTDFNRLYVRLSKG